MDENKALVVFQDKKIRRIWFNEEWWFVAVDIISALTESKNPSGYLKDMRRRDESFAQGWGQIATPLRLETKGGYQNINCISTKGAFRLIQSIPSPKAEPFKQWLAQVGYERVQEIENPELAQKRMKEIYRAKGYSDYWLRKVEKIAISVNRTILIKAVKFRHENKKRNLSFFDCVGYIFAIENNMKFVTGDRQFEDREGVEYIKKD